MPPSFPHHRPPLWPEGEAWPPTQGQGWRPRGRGFFWRIAVLVALFFLLNLVGCAMGLYALLNAEDLFRGQAGPPERPAMPMMMGRSAWPGLAVLGVVVVVGVGVVATALRRTTAPVGEVMEAAERVAAGDYSVRVREAGPSEVRGLARAFNAMTTRLAHNEQQRRALLADVTHELRTPLAVVQGNLEALIDGVYPADEAHLAPVLEETRVLARLIEDLRVLSLAESGALKLQREPTDLGVLVTEAVNAFGPSAAAAGVTLAVRATDDLPLLDLDPVRIREVVSNLVANALRYTPAGGSVTVTAELTGAEVVVEVRDTGQGIAPEALPHIFDRFYKSEASQGSGLGLAIARSLALAHAGALTVTSTLGQGTTLRLTLPHPNPQPPNP